MLVTDSGLRRSDWESRQSAIDEPGTVQQSRAVFLRSRATCFSPKRLMSEAMIGVFAALLNWQTEAVQIAFERPARRIVVDAGAGGRSSGRNTAGHQSALRTER